MIITVYIDESGTHGSSPIMIFGGYAGRLSQWYRFDNEWNKLLRNNGLDHFHYKEMKHRKGGFRRWSDNTVSEFVNTAIKIAYGTLFGFTIRLDEQLYNEIYIASNRPRKQQLDSRYGLCFRTCLSFVPELISAVCPQRPLHINFVLENGHKNFGDALRIFNQIKDEGIVGISEFMGACVPGEKTEYPGLQVADALASSAYDTELKLDLPDIDGALTDEIPNSSAMKDIARKLRRKSLVFRLTTNERVLGDLKTNILERIELKKQFGQRMKGD